MNALWFQHFVVDLILHIVPLQKYPNYCIFVVITHFNKGISMNRNKKHHIADTIYTQMDILDILCRLGLKLFTGEMGMDSFVVTIDRNTRTRTLDIKNEMIIAPIKNFVECTITGGHEQVCTCINVHDPAVIDTLVELIDYIALGKEWDTCIQMLFPLLRHSEPELSNSAWMEKLERDIDNINTCTASYHKSDRFKWTLMCIEMRNEESNITKLKLLVKETDIMHNQRAFVSYYDGTNTYNMSIPEDSPDWEVLEKCLILIQKYNTPSTNTENEAFGRQIVSVAMPRDLYQRIKQYSTASQKSISRYICDVLDSSHPEELQWQSRNITYEMCNRNLVRNLCKVLNDRDKFADIDVHYGQPKDNYIPIIINAWCNNDGIKLTHLCSRRDNTVYPCELTLWLPMHATVNTVHTWRITKKWKIGTTVNNTLNSVYCFTPTDNDLMFLRKIALDNVISPIIRRH